MNENDKIAIFKYGLIAPVINNESVNQTKYFKQAAEREYEYPGRTQKIQINWRTLKKWLHIYRKYGYEGLKPAGRKDRGQSRKIELTIQEQIRKLCSEYRFKTISNLYRYLIKEEIIEESAFTEVTLRNFLKDNNIVFDNDPKKPRKSFESAHINILWTTDFMHGPYVKDGKKKVKSYLCAIIDDYSRVITGGAFYLMESSLSLEKTLKDAVLTYGIPQKLYCDNGKVFVSGYIHQVCAKLGTALIHSKPYDSPSRGKIERFFRTVRDMFLPDIPYNEELNIEVLNNLFRLWLSKHYHQNFHRGINEKPVNRYLNDIPNVKIKEIAMNEADYYFYHTIFRTVKNDCTVLFQNELYEAPARFIGKKIEIRFPLDKPGDLRIFEDNKQTFILKKLDKYFNCETTIKYYRQEDENV